MKNSRAAEVFSILALISLIIFPFASYAGAPAVESVKVFASDAQANDNFGTAVAIDATLAVAGAPLKDVGSADAGAAYIFHRSALNTWDAGTALTAGTDAEAGARFGSAVDINGDFVIVGSPMRDEGSGDEGAAYIFFRTGTNSWDSGTKLTAGSDIEVGAQFGFSVGIDGDFVVVGAPFRDEASGDEGAAYIYNRIGVNIWNSVSKVTAGSDLEAGAQFGSSVAINGDYVVVGAPMRDVGSGDEGAAYVFHRTGTETWDEGTRLTAGGDLEAGARFGSSVAISGDYLIVGSPLRDGGSGDEGAAYIFLRTGENSWDAGTKITTSEKLAGDRLGTSVSIDGDFAVAGAPLHNVTGGDEGAVYVFSRTGPNSWAEKRRLTRSDALSGDGFGTSVDIRGEYALGGAPFHNETAAAGAGAAYVFASGISVSAASGNTTEAGGQATFTVSLNVQPASSVTIGVSSSDTSEAVVSPSSLTFSTSDWSTAQTVTVTGIDDTEADGAQTFFVRLGTASSADERFSGLDPEDVEMSNLDDDGGSNGGGAGTSSNQACFIATSAYGSPMAGEVKLLRTFRDRYLAGNTLGRGFIRAYYRYSPPIARYISRRNGLRAAVRVALAPLVYSIKHPYVVFFTLSAGSVALVRKRMKRRVRRNH